MSASTRAPRSTVCASISMMIYLYDLKIAEYRSVLDRSSTQFVGLKIGHGDLKRRLDVIEHNAERIGQVKSEDVIAGVKMKMFDSQSDFVTALMEVDE